MSARRGFLRSSGLRGSAIFVGTLGAVAWCAPGCVAERASAIDESESPLESQSAQPSEPADPNDPYGACVDTEDDGFDLYTCSIPGLSCEFGWASREACVAGDCDIARARIWQTCSHECESASDCPVPISGDAVPACGGFGACTLPCDEQTTCPTGFVCASMTATGGYTDAYDFVCVQYVEIMPYEPQPGTPPFYL